LVFYSLDVLCGYYGLEVFCGCAGAGEAGLGDVLISSCRGTQGGE